MISGIKTSSFQNVPQGRWIFKLNKNKNLRLDVKPHTHEAVEYTAVLLTRHWKMEIEKFYYTIKIWDFDELNNAM